MKAYPGYDGRPPPDSSIARAAEGVIPPSTGEPHNWTSGWLGPVMQALVGDTKARVYH